ncbi:hypothetical protein [Coxiella burnetii]|nr:hypothetical protein [Coxiella burnetii]ATN75059.1 hypothetical protein AYM90_08825 [Coxiella burnetii]ATN76961.1 hypothetical protein AYM94_08810 [Coxiella burnetii]ATN78878.1 hypothetical protein AYM93_08805 [Coxiella burnetii]ATN80790.1 hypothetical protein AYN00_08810 [Coxiella burnetii]OYK89633.1 hypothetical protein CbuQ195_09035 [Coxiella burnetii]
MANSLRFLKEILFSFYLTKMQLASLVFCSVEKQSF